MIDRNQGNTSLDEQYSAIWSRHGDGPEPSTADFLAEHPDVLPSERLEVVLTDQLLRWQCGRPRPVGDYLAEHPSLADDREAILKLVQGEFLARLDRGEAPEPDSYIQMFPGLAEEIRLQCEVDRWLTMPVPPALLMSMATTVDYRSDVDATDDGHCPDSTSGGPSPLEAPLAEADFERGRPLGAGGMGEVYEAVQKSLRKRVALKSIRREALDSPSRVRRFFVEARALARLRHPHIVGVHGIGRMADGRYFLVMDLVEDGTTLAALLRHGPVPFDRAAGLVATVADAIEHAHSRGVIHRDLKPSNVLLDADGRTHVTDFGLAKVFDSVDPDSPQTTADQILGTPHYMAPEQADRARGPITPRTDVFALGGLLYALLTGQPPIQGDSLTAILTQVVSSEPVPSPRGLRGEVPAALERVCGTCLEKDAEKRYPAAGAVAAALRAWLANPETETSADASTSSQEPTTRSGNDPDMGGLRSGWDTDRSLKDGGRTPNPGRWAPKAARSAGSRRKTWAAGVVASVLALLVIAVPLVQRQDARLSSKTTRIVAPVSLTPEAGAVKVASTPGARAVDNDEIKRMPPRTEIVVAHDENLKRPGSPDKDRRPKTNPSRDEQPAEPIRSRELKVADNNPEPGAELVPEVTSSEAALAKRGLTRSGRFYVVASESKYAEAWQGVVPFYNVMDAARGELVNAIQIAAHAQDLQDELNTLSGYINQWNSLMRSANRSQRDSLQALINQARLRINAVNTELATVRTRLASPARMEELKGRFLKARADFLEKSRELRLIRKAINEEYAALKYDADVKNALIAIKELTRAPIALGPSDKLRSLNLQLSQAEEAVGLTPDAYRRTKNVAKRRETPKENRESPATKEVPRQE